jgi:hypothetical protein
MAEDFRTLLKESSRKDTYAERWFADFEMGDAFFLSVQASGIHGSKPSALLDDVFQYEGFEVTIQTKQGVFTCGKRGAWQHLQEKPWFSLFNEESPILFLAEEMPAAQVQQVYEDMLEVVGQHPEVAKRGAAAKTLKLS